MAYQWLTPPSRTTTELTTNFATSISNLIGLANVEKGVEVVVRAVSTLLPFVWGVNEERELVSG